MYVCVLLLCLDFFVVSSLIQLSACFAIQLLLFASHLLLKRNCKERGANKEIRSCKCCQGTENSLTSNIWYRNIKYISNFNEFNSLYFSYSLLNCCCCRKLSLLKENKTNSHCEGERCVYIVVCKWIVVKQRQPDMHRHVLVSFSRFVSFFAILQPHFSSSMSYENLILIMRASPTHTNTNIDEKRAAEGVRETRKLSQTVGEPKRTTATSTSARMCRAFSWQPAMAVCKAAARRRRW